MVRSRDVFHVFANTITMKVAGADTSGALAMFIDEVPAGAGVPLHVHRGAVETAFVLKGRYKIRVGDDYQELDAGRGAYLPADVPHAYKNISSDTGQVLFTITPSNLEGFFEEIARSNLDPTKDLDAINKIAAKYQHAIVGPPID